MFVQVCMNPTEPQAMTDSSSGAGMVSRQLEMLREDLGGHSQTIQIGEVVDRPENAGIGDHATHPRPTSADPDLRNGRHGVRLRRPTLASERTSKDSQ